MITRYITNVELKKEALTYLNMFRSYLVKRERAQKDFEANNKNRIVSELIDNNLLTPGTEVWVKYNKHWIHGIIVGHPKSTRTVLCLESDRLNVSAKEYTNGDRILGDKGTRHIAKRKYFPFSSVELVDQKERLRRMNEEFDYPEFQFSFKYASDAFQKSIKDTICTKEAVDKAIAAISPKKVYKYPICPDDRFASCQKAIKDGLDWENVIQFLYRGRPVLGTVGYYTNLESKMLKVYSLSLPEPKYMKYISKSNFIQWIHDDELQKSMLNELTSRGV